MGCVSRFLKTQNSKLRAAEGVGPYTGTAL